MSTVSGSQYGVGLITLLVAASIAVGYYQMYWLPEQLAKPAVDEHVLHPVKSTIIEMIVGSANADQQDNYVPKLVNLQLSIDNLMDNRTEAFKFSADSPGWRPRNYLQWIPPRSVSLRYTYRY